MDEEWFDGKTFNPYLDGARLTAQLGRIFAYVSDGHWHTLHDISLKTGDPEASVSARLRDFRKARFGGWHVQRRRASPGEWGLHEYRVLPPYAGPDGGPEDDWEEGSLDS